MADHQNRFFHRKKIMTIFFVCAAVLCGLLGRLLYLMVWRAEYYEEAATRLHERERSIKAARGRILDRNGVVLADNKMVCTVSVIHNQIEEPEQVIAILVKELGISEEEARKRVEKYSSIERVKSNVDKTVGDRIREYDLAGVKVDEDYKRYYPYGDLASKVLGFTGGDNQGIIGLEVVYEEILQGDPGMILTITDAKGIEVDTAGERRVEPVPGMDLRISIDRNIQEYATQLAAQACATKEADSVYIVAMNPQNGEILAMVNYPEFDLNDPYTLPELTEVKEDGSIVAVDPATLTVEQKQEKLYLLMSKDVLLAQCKKVIYCLFSKKTGNKIMEGCSYANVVFGGFINGKILDSCIIGIICFIFTSAVHMRYAVLISVVVGVTNIIPFFGPFIGAVPGALLALMDDPIMFVVFIIWIIVLQQFDGNILGPLILGDATGISGIWVLLAILVGGDLFGVAGMILGVPVFACLYAFFAVQLRDKLRAKDLSSATGDYIRLKKFDEETGEPIYQERHDERKTLRESRMKQVFRRWMEKMHLKKHENATKEAEKKETEKDEK